MFYAGIADAGAGGRAGHFTRGDTLGLTERALQFAADGDSVHFYNSTAWRNLRAEVQRSDRHECVICKSRGRYSKGALVHHVKPVADRPDLALSVYDPDTGERQLITVCKRCHEDLHNYELKPRHVVSVERWD